MKLLSAFLLLFLLIPIAQASETYTVSPTGSHDQNTINDAIEKASSGDTIHLTSGIYPVDGPIYLKQKMKLTGDSDVVILVSKDISSPWFSPLIGVINCFDPFDIEISGFTIDGNCQNLNSDWANSNPSHAHDQLQLIKVIGTSNNFGKNVNIHDMTLCNSFGDGIQARLIDGIICEGNKLINCQHDSIFYKACKNCKMLNNRMAVITSDGGRFDNCFNGESEGNLVWKYNGSNNNGAFKGGANGFQVGDGGQSMGYDGRTNIIHTENIEIHNNTIIDPGRKAIVIDAGGQKPSDNVFIHDNIFVNTEDVERMGIAVSDDISYDNPPSVEESERVFSSIFDILTLSLIQPVYTETHSNLSANITEYRQDNSTFSLVCIDYGALEKVKYEYEGNESEYNIKYNSWSGSIPHLGDSLYINESVDKSKLKVLVYTNTTYSVIENYNYELKESEKSLFDPILLPVLIIIVIWVYYIYKAIKLFI